jgi:hypothetical protein
MMAATVAVAAAGLTACSDDSEEVNIATLYDICDIVQADASSTVLNLYPPTSTDPVVLTGGALSGATIPDAGTSIYVAYRPQGGKAYVSDHVDILSWAAINNIALQMPEDASALEGWDADSVEVVSYWRGGDKLYMRLRMPYSTTPRRFALLLDPTTVNDPTPTAYLYHALGDTSPTFNRQYYIAFNIAPAWTLPAATALRIRLASTPASLLLPH